MSINIDNLPTALLNSKALFNPYQYLPLQHLMGEKGKDNLLITDEVGVGKTFEAGIIMQELLKQNNNLRILLICPPKLMKQWEKEIYDNFFIKLRDLKPFLNNSNYTKELYPQFGILPYSFFKNPKDNDEELIEDPDPNQDQDPDPAAAKELPVPDIDFDLLILDEAHYIRNKGSIGYKCIAELIEKNSKAKCVFMTATPIFNKEDDYKNLEKLLELNGGFNVTKTLQGEANCYDYMLSIKHEIVEPSTEETDVFNELKVDQDDEDKDEDNGAEYGQLTGFLGRAAASSIDYLKTFLDDANNEKIKKDLKNFRDQTGEKSVDVNNVGMADLKTLLADVTKDSKLDKLTEILKKIKTTKEKNTQNGVIIFSSFIHTCDYLEEKLNEAGYQIFLYIGSLDKNKADNLLSKFKKTVTEYTEKNEDKLAILICSDVAKEGLNLQFCQHLIHYDPPFTPAAIGQRNGRIYRKGQKGKPTVYFITVKGSYDDRLFDEIIKGKAKIIDDLAKEEKIAFSVNLPGSDIDFIKEIFTDAGKINEGDELPSDWNTTYSEILLSYYKKKYDERLRGFFKFIGITDLQGADLENQFKDKIKEIVGDVETEFFYDEIDDMDKYKKSFKPYRHLKKGGE